MSFAHTFVVINGFDCIYSRLSYPGSELGRYNEWIILNKFLGINQRVIESHVRRTLDYFLFAHVQGGRRFAVIRNKARPQVGGDVANLPVTTCI